MSLLWSPLEEVGWRRSAGGGRLEEVGWRRSASSGVRQGWGCAIVLACHAIARRGRRVHIKGGCDALVATGSARAPRVAGGSSASSGVGRAGDVQFCWLATLLRGGGAAST